MTMTASPLELDCPACHAEPGGHCHDSTGGRKERGVHWARGKLAGLTPNESLNWSYVDVPSASSLALLGSIGDDHRLAVTALRVAIGMLEQAGAHPRDVATLRRVLTRLGVVSGIRGVSATSHGATG